MKKRKRVDVVFPAREIKEGRDDDGTVSIPKGSQQVA